MQEQRDDNRGRPLILIGVALVAALLGLAGGMAIANALLEPEDTGLEARLTSAEAQLSQAQGEIQGLETDLAESEGASQALAQELDQAEASQDTLKTQLSQAEARLSSAQEELAQKTSEMEDLLSAQREVERLWQEKVNDLEEMADTLERHRLLLVEMRKDLPLTREDALTHWDRVKSLASRADPALAAPVDQVILKIDNYFDWGEREPGFTASSEDRLAWAADYTLSGASAYDEAIATLSKDTLLAVITQMDLVVGRLG